MIPDLRIPSTDELSRLKRATSESGRRATVQIGGSFARAEDYTKHAHLPVLFKMGEVPLKLYLTWVMMTLAGKHELYRDSTAEAMALLLGLDSPENSPAKGTRRVQRATAALADAHYISLTPRPKRLPLIRVWHPPNPHPPYITLPLELWSNGWLNVLPAPALAIYTALRLASAGDESRPFHIRPYDRDLYGIGDDTWTRGTAQLKRYGLLSVDFATPDDMGVIKRRRNVYQLHTELIKDTRPGAPASP